MEIWTSNRTSEAVLIDEEDYELVRPYKWYRYPSCRYVTSCINGKTTSIHRLIMGAVEGQAVDHRNGNRLDNRKENLRICAQSANMKNRRPNKSGMSSYKGVVVLSNGRYRAKIDSDGKRYELGVYPSERDASVAYNAAAKILHGEFAYLNELPPFPAWNTRQPTPQGIPGIEGVIREVEALQTYLPFGDKLVEREAVIALLRNHQAAHKTDRPLSPDNPCPDHKLRIHDVCPKCGMLGAAEYLLRNHQAAQVQTGSEAATHGTTNPAGDEELVREAVEIIWEFVWMGNLPLRPEVRKGMFSRALSFVWRAKGEMKGGGE